MEPAAGLADHGFVTGVRIVSGLVRQPVLHVHAGTRTFKYDIGHIPASLGPARLSALIPINAAGPGRCQRAPTPLQSGLPNPAFPRPGEFGKPASSTRPEAPSAIRHFPRVCGKCRRPDRSKRRSALSRLQRGRRIRYRNRWSRRTGLRGCKRNIAA